jgi:hypothetical protein
MRIPIRYLAAFVVIAMPVEPEKPEKPKQRFSLGSFTEKLCADVPLPQKSMFQTRSATFRPSQSV